MGSGKTTLGTAVSCRAGIPFIDLDQHIERLQKMSVKEIFNLHGEAGFRRLEHEALVGLSAHQDVLIACGGGTPCFFDNMALMNSCGTTVFLEASTLTLHRRLVDGRDSRPLIASMDNDALMSFIKESMDRRVPYYSMAGHRFNTDRLDNSSEIDTAVDIFTKQFLTQQ